jgi:hypothetical protein
MKESVAPERDTCRMEFADRVRSALSSTERQALSDAMAQIDDFLLAALVELYHETGPAALPRPFRDRFQPGCYVDFYDFKMTRRMYPCPLAFAGRLQDGWEPPRCRGEELVLRELTVREGRVARIAPDGRAPAERGAIRLVSM